jgi:hypothetical protein
MQKDVLREFEKRIAKLELENKHITETLIKFVSDYREEVAEAIQLHIRAYDDTKNIS